MRSFEAKEKDLSSYNFQTDEYLKKPILNNKILDYLNQKSRNLISKSNLEIENLKDIILNGRYLNFESNKAKLNELALGKMHEKLNCILNSSILSDTKQMKDLMTLCDFSAFQKWNLIYRASRDGFEAARFHTNCDDKSNTFVIVKSAVGNIFGGYTEQPWSGLAVSVVKSDANALIFSLINKQNRPLKIKSSQNEGICCSIN